MNLGNHPIGYRRLQLACLDATVVEMFPQPVDNTRDPGLAAHRRHRGIDRVFRRGQPFHRCRRNQVGEVEQVRDSVKRVHCTGWRRANAADQRQPLATADLIRMKTPRVQGGIRRLSATVVGHDETLADQCLESMGMGDGITGHAVTERRYPGCETVVEPVDQVAAQIAADRRTSVEKIDQPDQQHGAHHRPRQRIADRGRPRTQHVGRNLLPCLVVERLVHQFAETGGDAVTGQTIFDQRIETGPTGVDLAQQPVIEFQRDILVSHPVKGDPVEIVATRQSNHA